MNKIIKNNIEVINEIQKVIFINYTPHKISKKSDKKLSLLI